MSKIATNVSNLELNVTVDPLLDAGPLLLPAALLPQLTLDTGPLETQRPPHKADGNLLLVLVAPTAGTPNQTSWTAPGRIRTMDATPSNTSYAYGGTNDQDQAGEV